MDLSPSSRFAAYAPLIGGLAVFAVYRLFFIEASIDSVELGIRGELLSQNPAVSPDRAAAIAGRLSWSITGTVFLLAFLGSLLFLLRIVQANLGNHRSHVRRRILIAATISSLAVFLLSYGENPFAVKGFDPILIRTYALLEMRAASVLFQLFTPMVLTMLVLLMVAAATALARIPAQDETTALHLRTQLRSVNATLFVGATILVAGIVHAGSAHRLALRFLGESEQALLNDLVSHFSASTGTVWTLMLLGIYLPALWILQLRAQRLARDAVDEKTPEKIDGWLASHGLTAQLSQRLSHVAALLGPLIVGGPAAPLFGLLGG